VDQATATVQPPSVPPVAPLPIVFQNLRPQFRRLVFRGAMLELITVGFYRFWLATDIRRHIWHATSVDGDALEYTGTGWELFLGFVFALVILGPIYLAYFLIGLEAERYQAFASVPFGLFFYLFWQFAVFRARRYRMTRTIWRGVRFWMTGSGWNYAWRSALLMLLVVLTAGLFLPWREAILERFKMRHSHYGDLQGRFEGTGWEFFKRGILVWLLIPGVLIAGSIIMGVVAAVVGGLTGKKIVDSVGAVLPLFFWLGAPFFYAAFKAIQWRWWISGIRFGEVSFSSTIRARNLFGLYWKVVGWSFLIFAILGVVATGITALAPGGNAFEKIFAASDNWQFLTPLALCYVMALLLMTAVMRIYLIHDFTARVAAVTTVHNIEAAQNVVARGDTVNALGEGFANSLDIFGY